MSKLLALAFHLECDPDELSESNYDSNTFIHGRREYLVCTDEEANELAQESLESLAKELIPRDVLGTFAGYIDTERWAQDVLISDGRANTLARYDGDEHEVCLGSEDLDYLAGLYINAVDGTTREDFDEMYGNDAELNVWFYIYRVN